MGKNRKLPAPPGGFAGIPRIVMETEDYKGLSFKSKALLMELAFQLKQSNNGDLTVAFSVLRERGWTREATISEAIKELISADLVIKTREGKFLNPGGRCALYAVTWRAVDECPGKDLDVSPTAHGKPVRAFSTEGKNKNPVTQNVSGW